MLGVIKVNPDLAGEFQKFHQALAQSRTVLITTTYSIDGDAIGAELALYRIISQKFPAISIEIINQAAISARYRFLPGAELIKPFHKEYLEKRFDLGIVVDGGIDRIGSAKPIFENCQVKVAVDHHMTRFAYPYDIDLCHPTISSTTELIFCLNEQPDFQVELTPELAQYIYLGMVYDTGSFRHSNTTPATHRIAARLLETGFDFTHVLEQGMYLRSESGLHLLGEVLHQVSFNPDHRIAWGLISREMMERWQASSDDVDGIIDNLFLIHGVEIACLITEVGPQAVKVSLRARGGWDVSQIARTLDKNGGGHKKAAGCTLALPKAEAVVTILSTIESAIKRDECRQ
jgi:phosphoesterase RecJ-like protein